MSPRNQLKAPPGVGAAIATELAQAAATNTSNRGTAKDLRVVRRDSAHLRDDETGAALSGGDGSRDDVSITDLRRIVMTLRLVTSFAIAAGLAASAMAQTSGTT